MRPARSSRTLLEVARPRLAFKRAFTANICACFGFDDGPHRNGMTTPLDYITDGLPWNRHPEHHPRREDDAARRDVTWHMGGGGSRARVAPDDGFELEYLPAPTTGAGSAWGLKANVKGGLGSQSGSGSGSGRRGAQGNFKSMGRRVINTSVHSVASTVHSAHRKVAQHHATHRRAGGGSSTQ